MVLAGCGDAGSASGERNRFTELPTFPVDAAATPSPTPTEDPTAGIPAFVSELLDPGPTLDPAQRIFFRNGRDLWMIQGDDIHHALEPGTRFGAYATSPHGQRAAVVIISEKDGEQVEQVHVFDGNLGPALTPERITSGPNAQSPIRALTWSNDATRIAITYDEPVVAILEIARPNNAVPQIVSQIHLPEGIRRIIRVEWSTIGNGLALLAERPGGQRSIWLASLAGEVHEISEVGGVGKSVADIAWLPGRGRIAFAEERLPASPITGGSMFSIAPDGTGRELLVSSGTFAPAAEIMEIAASPGGRFIAFSVSVPGSDGEDRFHSAWLLNMDSGEVIQVPITPGFRVTDLWWTTEGLLWRAVHRDAEVIDSIATYAGVEPFAMGRFNPENNESRTVYQSVAN